MIKGCLLFSLLLLTGNSFAGFPPMQATAKLNSSNQAFYVAKDKGSDANDCSIFRPCATIQAGINAANLVSAYYKQTVVHVSPPTTSNGYQESLTLSQQGVNLVCDSWLANSRACKVKGNLTINLSGVSGGSNYQIDYNEAYLVGFYLETTSGDAITFSGTAFQRVTMQNVYVDAGGSTGSALVASNSGTSSGSKSVITFYDSVLSSSNSTNPTIAQSNSRIWFYGTTNTIANSAANDSLIQSGASTSFVCYYCSITGQVNVTNNTASISFYFSSISSATQSCIDTPSSASTGVVAITQTACTSTNTNTITGSGVVALGTGNARISSSGDIVSTVTQAVSPGLPEGEKLLGTGATTGTNVLLSVKGGHIKMANVTAPTAVVNANAGTGGSPACTLTTGTDGAGKVNLTTGTSAWASGTQCTITFNKAYGVAPICIFSPNNASAASKAVSQQVNFTTTTTTMLVSFGAADTAQTTYAWAYNCMETL